MLLRRSAPSRQGSYLASLGIPQGIVTNRALVAGDSLRSHADHLPPGQTRWSVPLSPRISKPELISALARAFLHGEPAIEQLIERAAHALGRNWRWLRPVARRYAATFAGKPRPTHRAIAAFLRDDETVDRAWQKRKSQLTIATRITGPAPMQPVAVAANWPIPAINSIGELAQWFGLSITDLEWFSDLKYLATKSRTPQLHHYQYKVLTKSTGSLRLIEAPKFRLKKVQRQILHQILQQIPVHSSVHGFVPGRSIKTFASLHAGRPIVLRIDLHDFFPTIARARIQALFRTVGYPESVANLLGGICTNATPKNIWKHAAADIANREAIREASQLYARPHLPQGAPTSPALANLCAFRLDCRLSGLAQAAGAAYARYADDLAFSGAAAFARSVQRFALHVAAIAAEEGWQVNHRKTRIMRQGVRQRLVGLVTNTYPNIIRPAFDRLKATLTNCVRHGPATQNRDKHPAFREHLEGRISFVESINAAKGRRLRALFHQIRW